MPTAFVTGGSGFIGGALVRRLLADGVGVRALARSEASARAAGAEPVPGDLGDSCAMALGADGCDVAFHCAARVDDPGSHERFEAVNLGGTRHALDACARAGVRRFAHVGTQAAPPAGEPLVHADERAPLRFDSPVAYCATKARAEEAVLAARRARLRTVGGGRHRTATAPVDNPVLAVRAPAPGPVYLLTDGAPVVFRDFATQGQRPPRRGVPRRVAAALAAAADAAWRALPPPGRPPLTRRAVWLSGLEVTIDMSRARTELGYAPVRTVAERLGVGRRGTKGAAAMRIAVGSDHAGFHLKEHVKAALAALGHDIVDVGTVTPGSVDYPQFAAEAARLVGGGEADRGVLACGSGVGVAIVANKVPGVRAVNAHDSAEAEMARRHNDANVVTLSGARLGPQQADAIVAAFLRTEFEGGRHARRVGQIAALEDQRQEAGTVVHP